jgi:hypothetical protein
MLTLAGIKFSAKLTIHFVVETIAIHVNGEWLSYKIGSPAHLIQAGLPEQFFSE